MKRFGFIVGAVALVVVLAPADVTGAATAGSLHFPDLRTMPPSDLHVSGSSNSKELRFSNVAYNAGDGRLELKPNIVGRGRKAKTKVTQHLYTHDDGGTWSIADTHNAGTYTFHRNHNHWHFEGFALYELVDANNPGTVHRTGTKTTFCIIDTESPATMGTGSLDHAASWPRYQTCDRDSTTGLSVGWGDKYGYWLDGQSINISGLPDGTYILRSTADPEGKIREKDDGNNSGSTIFCLRGDQVSLGAC